MCRGGLNAGRLFAAGEPANRFLVPLNQEWGKGRLGRGTKNSRLVGRLPGRSTGRLSGPSVMGREDWEEALRRRGAEGGAGEGRATAAGAAVDGTRGMDGAEERGGAGMPPRIAVVTDSFAATLVRT